MGASSPAWRGYAGAVVLFAASAALGLWLHTTGAPSQNAVEPPGDAVQKVLRTGKPTVVEFGANSCASCRDMKPVLHALAQDPRVAVADVDILRERDYIGRYQIRLMPTQVFYDAHGQEIGRHMGKLSGAEILARLGLDGTAIKPAL